MKRAQTVEQRKTQPKGLKHKKVRQKVLQDLSTRKYDKKSFKSPGFFSVMVQFNAELVTKVPCYDIEHRYIGAMDYYLGDHELVVSMFRW